MGEAVSEDTKFGIHMIWMIPYCLIVSAVEWTVDTTRKIRHNTRIQRILKKNPDIKELSELAGIKK